MKLAVFLLSALAFHTHTFTEGAEMSSGKANAESFVAVHAIDENSIEVNKTRYKLQNVSISNQHVDADLEHYPDHMSLLHPNFWTYWIHTVCQVITAIMALKSPKALLILLVAAVLCWPLSWMLNEPIWHMNPGESTWWLMAIKSAIVNIAPTAPMLLCLIFRPSPKVSHRVGIWGYFILWSNVFWTLFFLPMAFNAVSVTNAVCAISLGTSLIVYLVALCKKGVALCEVRGKFFYGYGTPLSWLVCYTVWNGLFVVEAAVGLVFQDIAFWGVMLVFYYWSNCRTTIENYFAMARPISLSTFIASSDWPGFLSFFKEAEPLDSPILTRHAFFLFLAVGNLLFSFYVLYWTVCCLLDYGGADEYLTTLQRTQVDDGYMDTDSDADDSTE